MFGVPLSNTSHDENCREFELETDGNHYADLRQMCLVLKLKIVKGHGFETYNTKAVEIEHKKEAKAVEETSAAKEEQEPPFLLVTHGNNNWHSIFSNVEVYDNNQQIYNCNGLRAQKPYISNNFKGAISEYKGVLHC